MPAQWEFQVGPTEGIHMGDDLWVARYLDSAQHPFNLLTFIYIISTDHRPQVHSPESRGGLWSCGHVRSQANGKH